MRLLIIDKPNLTPVQAKHIDARLDAPEHELEHQFNSGHRNGWRVYRSDTLYGFVLNETGLPIGIAEASGPLDSANPGWWLDSLFRGQGLGNEVVDLLAARLKQKGYVGVGSISVQTIHGMYDEQSSKLVRRFRAHFGSMDGRRRTKN